MPLALKLGIYTAVVVIGLVLTRAPEVRHQRWWKIPLGLLFATPIVSVMGITMTREHKSFGMSHLGMFIVCLAALAVIWVPNISFTLADSVTKFFYGDPNPNASFRTDYRRAKTFLREGDLKEALKATQYELEKDPKNYEGLLILAAIYEQMNLPANAVLQMNIILENSDATPQQKDIAASEKKNYELQVAELETTRRKKKFFA